MATSNEIVCAVWKFIARRLSSKSPATANHEDFPLTAKDFSGGSLFASEPWIEGHRFVVPATITTTTSGPVNHHAGINRDPVLLKTCIPLPVEDGVFRPTCPVIQRQPRVEIQSASIGMDGISSLHQPVGGANPDFISGTSMSVGVMAILFALAIWLYFPAVVNPRKGSPKDPRKAHHQEPDKNLVTEALVRLLTEDVEEKMATIAKLQDLLGESYERNLEVEVELEDVKDKVDENRKSMKSKDELAKKLQAILEEKDSLIKKQEAIMAEQESAIKEQQDTLARLGAMEEIFRQKEKEIEEKESTIAQLTEEKQAAAEQASTLGSIRDRLTKQLEEANKELRNATYFDKDLSRRREEQLTKQNKKLHTRHLHINALKAQIEELGQVPVPPPPGDATAPAPTSEEPGPASPAPAPAPSAPAARPQSIMDSRWADTTHLPPSRPAAFRGGWQGRGRGRGRGGR